MLDYHSCEMCQVDENIDMTGAKSRARILDQKVSTYQDGSLDFGQKLVGRTNFHLGRGGCLTNR